MITELLKRLITKKNTTKKKADIENKLNVFYAMSKITDEEYSELTLLVEDTYTEVTEEAETTKEEE